MGFLRQSQLHKAPQMISLGRVLALHLLSKLARQNELCRSCGRRTWMELYHHLCTPSARLLCDWPPLSPAQQANLCNSLAEHQPKDFCASTLSISRSRPLCDDVRLAMNSASRMKGNQGAIRAIATWPRCKKPRNCRLRALILPLTLCAYLPARFIRVASKARTAFLKPLF